MDETPGATPPRGAAVGGDPAGGGGAAPDEDPNIVERERDRDRDAVADDPGGRLARYLARTERPLDVLALLTLWIVVVPVADFGDTYNLRGYGIPFRVVLSVIYAIDMTIRTSLVSRHWHYLRTHPVGVMAVVFPPVRVLFSLRLIRELFRRGNLPRFLVAALLLLINGALIVWLFERTAPGANIETLGESVWWSIVTVTTVGYGDYFPITVPGQVVATLIMFIGIVTVAVITAQVASTFVDQSAKRARVEAAATAGLAATSTSTAGAGPSAGPAPDPPGAAPAVATAATIEDLDARLARIEALLHTLVPPGAGDEPGPSGG